jgi:hypothetical protein
MFVFEDLFHSPVDRIRRVFHATPQVDLSASNNATSKSSLQLSVLSAAIA